MRLEHLSEDDEDFWRGEFAQQNWIFGALKLSVASWVMLSLVELPVSLLSATVGVAMVVSSVKLMLALAVLPAVSVSVTTTVWLPSAAGAV